MGDGAAAAWGAALRDAARAAADALWPPVCAACGAEAGAAGGLCPDCFAGAGFLTGPVCDRCGAPVAAEGLVCPDCAAEPPAFDRARSAALYQGAARRAALALKHGDRLDVARPAAAWMLRAGADLVAAADLIAPAPLHWTRLLRRRSNQSAELARWLARLAGREAAFAPDLLTRTRATPSQDGRTRAGRAANVAGAFAVAPRWAPRLPGARVLLVDDVLTTGATLSACALALRRAGAAGVDALTLARVAREGQVGF
jgi:predicted amidophosphoribosyltransferase